MKTNERSRAGRSTLEYVLETIIGGSLEEALAALLDSRKDQVTAEERERLTALFEQTKKEGR